MTISEKYSVFELSSLVSPIIFEGPSIIYLIRLTLKRLSKSSFASESILKTKMICWIFGNPFIVCIDVKKDLLAACRMSNLLLSEFKSEAL